jgi:hypothetical protein
MPRKVLVILWCWVPCCGFLSNGRVVLSAEIGGQGGKVSANGLAVLLGKPVVLI